MKKIKRDPKKDLFMAAFNLVKENGHYAKAETIMESAVYRQRRDSLRKLRKNARFSD